MRALLFVLLMVAGVAAAEGKVELKEGQVACDDSHCAMTRKTYDALRQEMVVQYMASRYMDKIVERQQAIIKKLEDERKKRCAAVLEVVPDKRI